MPCVGGEQRDVTRGALEQLGRPAVVLELRVVHAVERREAAGAVAAGYDGGRPVGDGAVAQQDVRADGEDRIRDPVVPLDAGRPRDVRTGVAVPRTATEVG